MPGKLNEAINTQLATAFIARNDVYNRWGNLASSYLVLPALRGFWPGGAAGPGAATAGAGYLIDQSGLGNHLVSHNSPVFWHSNLMPIVSFNGSNQYFDISDAASNNSFDVSGTEGYIQNVVRGVTVGCWIYPNLSGSGVTQRVIAKTTGAVANNAYDLRIVGDVVQFVIGDGVTNTGISGTTVNFDSWNLIVGFANINTGDLGLLQNGIFYRTTHAHSAIINNGTNFTIGARIGGSYFNGDMSMMFITAMSTPESHMTALWEQGKVLYGI